MMFEDVGDVLYVKWWLDFKIFGFMSCVGDIGIYVVYLV